MLDIGGTITCRIYNHLPGLYVVYILAEDLGIEPGETSLLRYYNEEGSWHIQLYISFFCKNKRRRTRKLSDNLLARSIYYNEIIKLVEIKRSWFIQEVKASIILPIIKKKRSKFQKSLIYVDEYWKM